MSKSECVKRKTYNYMVYFNEVKEEENEIKVKEKTLTENVHKNLKRYFFYYYCHSL